MKKWTPVLTQMKNMKQAVPRGLQCLTEVPQLVPPEVLHQGVQPTVVQVVHRATDLEAHRVTGLEARTVTDLGAHLRARVVMPLAAHHRAPTVTDLDHPARRERGQCHQPAVVTVAHPAQQEVAQLLQLIVLKVVQLLGPLEVGQGHQENQEAGLDLQQGRVRTVQQAVERAQQAQTEAGQGLPVLQEVREVGRGARRERVLPAQREVTEVGRGAPKELDQRAQPTAIEVGQAAQGQKGLEVPEVTEVEVGQRVLGEVGQGHTVQLKVMPLGAQEDQSPEVLALQKVTNQIQMIL